MSIKRTLALILALAMIFSLGVPTYAFAEEGETEESVEALAPVEVIDEIEEAEAISFEPVAETEGSNYLEDPAAVVAIEGTTVNEYFETLQEAINAAGTPSEVISGKTLSTTVTLQKNVTENLTIANDVIVVGAGKTVTGTTAVSSGNVKLQNITLSDTLTLSGGDLILETVTINALNNIVVKGGTLNIAAGSYRIVTAEGATSGNVTGGSYLHIDSVLLADGVVPAPKDGYADGTPIGASIENNSVEKNDSLVAKIGTGAGRVYYSDFDAAVDAAAGEETIVLLADVDYLLPEGKTMIVDANGKTFNVTTASGIALQKEGDKYTAVKAIAYIKDKADGKFATVGEALEAAADNDIIGIYIQLRDAAIQRGLARPIQLPSRLKLTNCMAHDKSFLTILPDGRLGKCEHESEEYTIGSIYEEDRNQRITQAWGEQLSLPECSECCMAPWCTKLKMCAWNREGCTTTNQALQRRLLEDKIRNSYEREKNKTQNQPSFYEETEENELCQDRVTR